MSFYGNITNTSRTHFQFDRIYSSRTEMEECQESDGIYSGRFVLVEYNTTIHLDSFLKVSKKDNKFYISASNETSQDTLLTNAYINKNDIVYEYPYEESPQSIHWTQCIFYKCDGFNMGDNSAILVPISNVADIKDENIQQHIQNYTLDQEKYNRSYDSTVWQKVYEDGIEKYILIAELNTIIPEFDLQADAPTQTPIAPHFDVQSSNVYYRLHHQPQWGFRVKSAKPEQGPQFNRGQIVEDASSVYYTSNYPEVPYQSDEKTQWVRHEYNPDTGNSETLYWHSGNKDDGTFGEGSWTTDSTEEIPAAIYYNKAGFNKEIVTKSSLEDHILVESSGISGQQYSSHNDIGNKSAQEDIQELSIMLPSIGNSIADMWDLIYGIGNDDGRRNLDMDWGSVNGLRMVSQEVDPSHFSYDPEKTATLAGVVNSVHDLMGMIIEVTDVDFIDEEKNKTYAALAEDDKIYYSNANRQYYRRAIDYVYDENSIYGSEEEDIELAESVMNEISYKQISFVDFPSNTFYYGTFGEVFELETNDYPTYNRTYYTTSDEEPFFNEITAIPFDSAIHYKYENETYSNTDETLDENADYYTLTIIPLENQMPFKENTYYIYNPAEDESLKGSDIGNIDDIQLKDMSIYNEAFNENYIYYIASIIEGGLKVEKVNVFEITENHYYYNDNDQVYYKLLNATITDFNDYKFAEITNQTKIDHFYIPNKYYIEEASGKYRTYKEAELGEDVTLYALNSNVISIDLTAPVEIAESPEQFDKYYYIANTYYYQPEDSRKKKIDTANKATENRTYYKKEKTFYVYRDRENLMPKGSEWNEEVRIIPAGIFITTRQEVPVMESLDGFARGLNTIHGLILKINQMLLSGDVHTRDSHTVQGAINIINDIIAKFEIIAPGQFVIVDDYGRVHSATHSEDNWIDIEIDSNVIEPNVSITHKFNPVNDTTSTSSQDINSSDGNIELYTPIVDDKGHIVGKNIETVELPHSFKTIKVGNTPIIANNHIASINIANEDKWIRVNANANTDTLIINHIGPASGGTTTYSKNDTPKFGASFNIPTITYDSKGHISESSNHTVTLPTLSLIDNSSGNVLTGLTLDITTDTTGKLTLTKESIGTLALGETYSIAKRASAITNTDTLNTALGKLEYKVNRNVGSLTLGTYEKNDDAKAAITSADSIQLALRKLENRIKALEKK